jgi:transcriptional regulator with XRE-family HTH domain
MSHVSLAYADEAIRIRRLAPLTERDIARATGAGVSTVSAWLHRTRAPRGRRAERLVELSAIIERLAGGLDPSQADRRPRLGWLRGALRDRGGARSPHVLIDSPWRGCPWRACPSRAPGCVTRRWTAIRCTGRLCPDALPGRDQWPFFQRVGEQLHASGFDGLMYRSAAHPEGCAAAGREATGPAAWSSHVKHPLRGSSALGQRASRGAG